MNKALFRFRDGRVASGELHDSLPLAPDARTVSAVLDDEGSPGELPLEELKAVFMLRPFDLPVSGDDRVRVALEFADGEILRGTTPRWQPGPTSLVMIPDDRTRVDAVVVVASALVGVEIVGPAERE